MYLNIRLIIGCGKSLSWLHCKYWRVGGGQWRDPSLISKQICSDTDGFISSLWLTTGASGKGDFSPLRMAYDARPKSKSVLTWHEYFVTGRLPNGQVTKQVICQLNH